jgi:serine/threonine-protein kinase
VTAPEPDALEGRMLGEHYRVGSRLGAGTMGVVHRVTHTLLRREFAAKLLAPALARDPEARARFLREAESLLRLSHPNIVTVRHFGEDDGRLYLVMDLCEGETLAALLAREGALEPLRAVAVALEILRALDAAHWEGIVHRDLKPANVMVQAGTTASGGAPRVRVLDFGLGRVRTPPDGTPAGDTQPGTLAGTVAYMAPEQVRADPDVDVRCDVFAVGCVLHEMLTGRPAFAAASPLTTAMAILDRPAPPLPAEGPRAVPAAVYAVVEKALAKDRAARYGSAAEMAEALREAVAGAPAPARKRARRSRAPWLVGVVGLAVLAAWMAQRPVGPRTSVESDADARALLDRSLARQALLDARFEEAEAAAARVVAGRRGNDDDLLLLASARAELGRSDVPALLDRLAARRGVDSRLAVERARFLGGPWQGDLSSALRELDRALPAEPDAEARSARSWLVYRQHRLVVQQLGGPDAPAELRARLDVEAAALAGGELGGVVAALAAAARGAREDAYALARAAADQHPDLADAAFAASWIAHDLGHSLPRPARADESRRWLERALAEALDAVARARRNPQHHLQGRNVANYWRHVCDLQQDLGDKEAAAATWENEVLARNPTHGEDLRVGAQYLQWAGRFEDALGRYAEARSVGQGDGLLHGEGYCHLQLGRLRADQGDLPAALASFDLALAAFSAGAARAPEDPVHRAYRAETHLARARAQREDAAAADLARAGEDFAALAQAGHASLPEVLFRRWEYHQALGDVRAALADARAAIASGGGVTAAHHRRLAWSCLESATGPDAAALLEEALRAADDAERWNPQRAEICCLLRARVQAGWARLASDDVARAARRTAALRELEKAVALGAFDSRVKAEAHLATSELLAETGDPAAALARAEEALALRTGPAPARGSVLLAHDSFLRTPLSRFHERLAAAYRAVGRERDAGTHDALGRALR